MEPLTYQQVCLSTGLEPTTDSTMPLPTLSSIRKLWRPKDASRSKEELKSDKENIENDIDMKLKRLKPSTSYDSDFWTANAEISRLYQLHTRIESRITFLNYKETSRDDNVSEDDWQDSDEAENLERQILAYRQAEEIAKKQASRLTKSSRTGLSAIFFKLFTSSPQGLVINDAHVGRRDSYNQSNMRKQMIEKYCPDAGYDLIWDPIEAHWERRSVMRVAHLYAWRQVESMDAIFGPGSKADIFSPENGLFLTDDIEKALDHGLIAIVPNVDLEPKDKDLPRDDLAERKQRLRDWENAPTKEYKVIVLDGDNKKVKKGELRKWRDGKFFKTLSDLNDRPLKFLTDFRPRARYVWWTFMNAILQTTWRRKENGRDILLQEVAKATRYWGSPGSYVKKSMLRGFADEIGQDIESILDISINDDNGDTGDTGDLYHETVVSTLEENVFQAKKAAKKVEDKSRDEDSEDESGDEDNEDEWSWTEEDLIWGRG